MEIYRRLRPGDPPTPEAAQEFFNNLACALINKILTRYLANNIFNFYLNLFYLGRNNLFNVNPCDFSTRFNNDFIRFWMANVARCFLKTQDLRNNTLQYLASIHSQDFFFIKIIINLLCGIAQRLQQHCGRQLSAPVDTDMQYVLWIKFKIKP